MGTADIPQLEIYGRLPGRTTESRLAFLQPAKLTAKLRHNAIGQLELTIPTTDTEGVVDSTQSVTKRTALKLDGSWIRMVLRNKEIYTGSIREWTETGPQGGTLTVRTQSHLRVLWGALVEPPALATVVELEPNIYRITYTTEALQVAAGNLDRMLIEPASKAQVARDWSRPLAINTGTRQEGQSFRVDSIGEKALPIIDAAGWGVRATASANRRSLTMYKPKKLKRPATDTSGVVGEWSVTYKRPTASGVIVAGQGEGVDRVFVADHAVDRTALTDDRFYLFKDARDTNDDATLVKRAKEILAENAAKVSISAELSEGPGFRFAADYDVGDIITLNLGGIEYEQQVREVQIDWTREAGLVIKPVLGEKETQEDRLVRAVADIGRRAGRLERR